jgi:hypothetical protein
MEEVESIQKPVTQAFNPNSESHLKFSKVREKSLHWRINIHS